MVLGGGRVGVAVDAGKTDPSVAAGEKPLRPLRAAQRRLPTLRRRQPSAGRLLPQHDPRPETPRRSLSHKSRLRTHHRT